MEELDIIIPPTIIQEIAEAESEFCKKVRKCDPLEGVKNLASGYKSTFDWLERPIGKKKLQGLKILEIGSGNGFFLCYALKNDLNIVGIEPGKTYGFQDRYSRAIKLLKLNGIENPEKYLFDASAEVLPFEDNTFDVVFSVAVLEHVQNLDMAMKESIRVLKPGGIMLANIPNYNSIYEGHYDIFWVPYMNKKMAKLYVEKLFGRDSYFIHELNFTTPSMFKKYLNSDSGYGNLYLHGRGLSNYVFEIYNICRDKNRLPNPKGYKGFKKIIISCLHFSPVLFFLKIPFFIIGKFLQFTGFAIVFDIVLYKREDKD